MNEFDKIIEDSLRHRAQRVTPTLGSYGDVSRRIARRRRRSTSVAMAAITAPALLAVGWAATRPDPVPGAASPVDQNGFPFATTTSSTPLEAGQYRCTGAIGGDSEWDYYQYCEFIGGFQTTTVVPDHPVPTTLLHPEALDHVLFLDASGGLPFHDALAAMLGDTPRFEMVVATMTKTMVMPVSADAAAAYDMLSVLGIAGVDSWTPDLVGGALPDGVTAVVVIGTDFFSRNGTFACAPVTTMPPATTTTSPQFPVDASPETTSYLPPTTTTVMPPQC
jgi:hypothetical protein